MRETDEESSPNDTCPSFLFKIFVLMWTIKVFIDFVTTSLLFLCFGFVWFFFFGCKTWGILAPLPGIEPKLPALEGKV